MWLTERLLRTFVPRWEQLDDPAVRTSIGCLQAWVCMALNCVLATGKFALGWMINSIALIADGGNNLADTLTSVVVLIGFRTASRGADLRHPHGHGRMESVTTLIITTLLVAVGLELLVESGKRLVAPQKLDANWFVVGALMLSTVIKEWMARFSQGLGRRIESSTLKADAWNYRTDAVASSLVAVAVVAAAFRVYWLDGVLGVGIALLVIYGGMRLLRASASYLIGESPGDQMLGDVKAAAHSVPGVVGIHDIEVHEYGAHRDVSLHIEVDAGATAARAHEIAEEVEAAVDRRLGVTSVVHVDPRPDLPGVAPEREAQAAVEKVLHDEPRVGGFHGLSITGSRAGDGRLHLHVVVSARMDLAHAHLLSHELEQRIAERLPGYTVTLHMEPSERCERPAQAPPPGPNGRAGRARGLEKAQ